MVGRIYLRPATPRTTRLSLVSVPVLSKQQTSTFPANGILKGSVQNTSRQECKKKEDSNEPFLLRFALQAAFAVDTTL